MFLSCTLLELFVNQSLYWSTLAGAVWTSRGLLWNQSRDTVQFTHTALLILFLGFPNITDLPQNVSPWWINKMSSKCHLILIAMFLPYLCFSCTYHSFIPEQSNNPTTLLCFYYFQSYDGYVTAKEFFKNGFVLVVLLFLVSFLRAALNQSYNHVMFLAAAHIKAAIQVGLCIYTRHNFKMENFDEKNKKFGNRQVFPFHDLVWWATLWVEYLDNAQISSVRICYQIQIF